MTDCPYCDGTLAPIEGHGAVHGCSNGADCPATFVAVFGGVRE